MAFPPVPCKDPRTMTYRIAPSILSADFARLDAMDFVRHAMLVATIGPPGDVDGDGVAGLRTARSPMAHRPRWTCT